MLLRLVHSQAEEQQLHEPLRQPQEREQEREQERQQSSHLEWAGPGTRPDHPGMPMTGPPPPLTGFSADSLDGYPRAPSRRMLWRLRSVALIWSWIGSTRAPARSGQAEPPPSTVPTDASAGGGQVEAERKEIGGASALERRHDRRIRGGEARLLRQPCCTR